MTERAHTGIALAIGALLLTYLTQCQPAHRPVAPAALAPTATPSRHEAVEEHEREGERDDEVQREERAKIKSVSDALKTIAADPERAKTYGILR